MAEPTKQEFSLKTLSEDRVKAIAEDYLLRNKDAQVTPTSGITCLGTLISVLQESGALHPALVGPDGRKRVREMLEKFSGLGCNASAFGKWLRPEGGAKAVKKALQD